MTCKFIQNRPDVPKRFPSKTAVSAVMPRVPLMMAVILFGGTPRSRANASSLFPRWDVGLGQGRRSIKKALCLT